MADTPAAGSAPPGLVAGQFRVDFVAPLRDAGGGVEAFAAHDERHSGAALMALRLGRFAPARERPITLLAGLNIPGLLLPLAHGVAALPDGTECGVVICQAPPGPSLAAAPRAWSEAELLASVLKPAALALDALAARGLTHRALRPDNIFRAGPGEAVVLGAAWAAPPASHQNAVFEPPYVAACHPAGRGEGSIADDIYALGVTLLTLALGHPPLAGLDEGAVIQRKLGLGSYAALIGEARLPGLLSDLLRGMLAEDPAHRPPPQALLDPSAARSRRVAARPPRRAQRPLVIAGQSIWEARTLAHALFRHPEEGVRLVRSLHLDHWLRRSLGDAALTSRVDEVVRQRGEQPPDDRRADATMVLRLVALLDPLAPLAWRGLALWPDGLGPLLAVSLGEGGELASRLEEIIDSEAVAAWAQARAEHCAAPALRQGAQQQRLWLRRGGPSGGLARVCYALNPLLPCASPLLAGKVVARLADLLPALEATAQQPERRQGLPLDAQIAAFIAARQDGRPGGERGGAASDGVEIESLRLLARLQESFAAPPLPGLAAWLAERMGPAIDTWNHRGRRAELAEHLRRLAQTGQLPLLLALLDNPDTRAADAQGLKQARAALDRINRESARLAANARARRALATTLGHEIALGIGMTALAASLGWMVLG